jgi:hypothetical protein
VEAVEVEDGADEVDSDDEDDDATSHHRLYEPSNRRIARGVGLLDVPKRCRSSN